MGHDVAPMVQNGAVARPESPQPPRGPRGRRTWVTVDDGHTPAESEPDTDHYVPRRRYPWHDDPDYDPAAHRRTPPPRPWTPPPPQDEVDEPSEPDQPAEAKPEPP